MLTFITDCTSITQQQWDAYMEGTEKVEDSEGRVQLTEFLRSIEEHMGTYVVQDIKNGLAEVLINKEKDLLVVRHSAIEHFFYIERR